MTWAKFKYCVVNIVDLLYSDKKCLDTWPFLNKLFNNIAIKLPSCAES